MNFTGENFFKSLKKIGIKNKDNLFIHSDVGLLKEYKNKKELNQTCKIIIKQLQKVVGKEGTIVFPTFTYSFPNKKHFVIFPESSKNTS